MLDLFRRWFGIPSVETAIASVGCLLFRSGPVAVAWCVITVVVFPVDRMLRGWAIAHVGNEILETMTPAFAHLDAATAVLWIVSTFLGVAPFLHQAPRVVLRRFCHPVRLVHSTATFGSKTSTGLNSAANVILSHNRLFTAVAFTKPVSVFFRRPNGAADDNKSSESFAGKIGMASVIHENILEINSRRGM